MFWKLQKDKKEKGQSKKSSMSPLFPHSLFALMWPEGWEVSALFLLPGGHDIPAGGFDHRSKMEICKWQDQNCENS